MAFSTIYAFGDSLSDAGNDSLATSLTGTTPVSPPYFSQPYGGVSGNTFSNGPTWVQDLSLALGLGLLAPSLLDGNDFAYGGAETGATPQNGGSFELGLISLPSQALQFELGVSRQQAAAALVTVSIGANDVLDILSQPGLSVAQQTADVAAAVGNEIGFLRRLAGDGVRTVLVLDVPDLGKTPTVLSGRAGGGAPSAAFDTLASSLSAQYDAALAGALPGVGLSATVVDAYGLIDGAVANPASYDLNNVAVPIWSGNYTDAGSGGLLTTRLFGQDQSLFWDGLHPTETGHQGVAALAERALGQTPAAEVAQVYAGVLQRAPDAAGLALWTNALSSGVLQPTGLDAIVAGSAEAQANVVPIVDMYTILGRLPDQAGLQAWVQRYEAGMPITAIGEGFLASSEGSQEYRGIVGDSVDQIQAFVSRAYLTLLGRTPDAAGYGAWVGRLESGVVTHGAMLADFVTSPEGLAHDAPAANHFLLAAAGGSADYAGAFVRV